MDNRTNRRRFLASAGSSFGAAWIATHWPSIAAAHAHSTAMAVDPLSSTLEFLTADEARDIDAIAAQIIPTDDTPGAREAGALYFIDRSLGTWAAAMAEPLRAGLREFRAGFAAGHPGLEFASADSASQIAYLAEVDQTNFFGSMRLLTLLGMFALPAYGGNRDSLGWRLMGFEDTHVYSPPFGYYDRGYPGFTVPKDGA